MWNCRKLFSSSHHLLCEASSGFPCVEFRWNFFWMSTNPKDAFMIMTCTRLCEAVNIQLMRRGRASSAFLTWQRRTSKMTLRGCLQCMFQSEVVRHCWQIWYLYNDDHCREVSRAWALILMADSENRVQVAWDHPGMRWGQRLMETSRK